MPTGFISSCSSTQTLRGCYISPAAAQDDRKLEILYVMLVLQGCRVQETCGSQRFPPRFLKNAKVARHEAAVKETQEVRDVRSVEYLPKKATGNEKSAKRDST